MYHNNETVSREAYRTESILAEGITVSNDTWQTGINNNVLVIGPSGSGKTRSYVKPNIMQANTSMIVSDAKGTLYEECGAFLRSQGYTVYGIDFVSMNGSVGYNPLDYIRYDQQSGDYCEQDIITASEIIIADGCNKEPFWDMAARMYLQSVIAYILASTPQSDHTLDRVAKLAYAKGGGAFEKMMVQYSELYPDSLAARRYSAFCSMGAADKMIGSVLGIVSTNLSSFEFCALDRLYRHPRKLDFSDFGRRKTALFLTVSDTDRSQDRLIGLFWTQALQRLCLSADRDFPGHRLDVPVRLYLDDFATNVYIPDFDKIYSNVRSREIYLSVILQSLSQLEALYGPSKAATIMGNCDQQVVLGVQDIPTASYFAEKADVPKSCMMNMPLGSCYVFLRGRTAQLAQKYDMTAHLCDRTLSAQDPAACEDGIFVYEEKHHEIDR